MAKKKCEFCEMAKQLGEEDCAAFKTRLLRSITVSHNDDMEVMNERLKAIKGSNGAKTALVDFIRDVSITAALVHAAHISVGKGDSLGDFVSEAAELWVDVREEPARAIMSSFVEHLNNSVIKDVAKKHSPNN